MSHVLLARWNHKVCWRGITSPASPAQQACSAQATTLLDESATIFAEPTSAPGTTASTWFQVRAGGCAPLSLPASHKDELERQCSTMLSQGLIRRSTSAFSLLVLLVKKADGTWRFCINYRALNAITVKDAFPIPVVDKLLDELHGARFITKLDLRFGYHHARMNIADVAKTTFRTHDQALVEARHAFGTLSWRHRRCSCGPGGSRSGGPAR